MGAIKLHRGSTSSMQSKNIVLEEGELFMEYPDTGISSKGKYKFKVGDGISSYNDIDYAIKPEPEIPEPTASDSGKFLMVNNNGEYYLGELGFEDGDEFDTKTDPARLINKTILCEVVHTQGTKPNDDGELPTFANIKKTISLVENNENVENSPRNAIANQDDDDDLD